MSKNDDTLSLERLIAVAQALERLLDPLNDRMPTFSTEQIAVIRQALAITIAQWREMVR